MEKEKFLKAEIIYRNTIKVVEKIKGVKEIYNDFLAFYDKKDDLIAIIPKKSIIAIETYETYKEDF